MTITVVNEQERNSVAIVYDTAADPAVRQRGGVTLTRSGVTVTATRAAHGYTNGQSVTVEGADDEGYNGTFVITVVDEDTFTYTLSTIPVTPATGTITVDGDAVASVTRTLFTATATRNGHGYLTGAEVVMAGADQEQYNGTFIITVTGSNTFTYELDVPPVTPATGSIYSADVGQSQWMTSPKAIQFSEVGADVTLKIEVAIRRSLGWQQLGADYTNADEGEIVPIPTAYNFVRVRRTAGTDDVLLHAQY